MDSSIIYVHTNPLLEKFNPFGGEDFDGRNVGVEKTTVEEGLTLSIFGKQPDIGEAERELDRQCKELYPTRDIWNDVIKKLKNAEVWMIAVFTSSNNMVLKEMSGI